MERAEAVRILREFRSEPEKRVLHAIRLVKVHIRPEEVRLLEQVLRESQVPLLVAEALQKLVLSGNTTKEIRRFVYDCVASGDDRDSEDFVILEGCLFRLEDWAASDDGTAITALATFAESDTSPPAPRVFAWQILAGIAGVRWGGRFWEEFAWDPSGDRANEMKTEIRAKLIEQGKWPAPG